MSNKVNIIPTEFKDQRNDDVSYGVRVYDDYISLYDNTWYSIPDDDFEVLSLVVLNAKNGDEWAAIIDHLRETESGVYVGSQWYNYCEIKHLLTS